VGFLGFVSRKKPGGPVFFPPPPPLPRKRSRKNQNISISSNSVYDSIAYDPLKTRWSELEVEAEEPTNHKAWDQTLWLVYSSTSASDSDS